MNKNDLKKLALMGITGGVMLTAQALSGALASSQPGMNPEELLAAGSWTQNSRNGCGGKNGCGGGNGGQGTNARPKPASRNLVSDNGGHGCGGKHGCGGGSGSSGSSGKGYNNGNGSDTYPEGNNGQNNGKNNTNRNYENRSQSDDADQSLRYRTPSKKSTIADQNTSGDYNSCGAAPNYQPETEDQFVRQLDNEGRRLYNSLDEEGKKLAMRLAKQFADKNQAVKQAAGQRARQDSQSSYKTDNSAKRQSLLK